MRQRKRLVIKINRLRIASGNLAQANNPEWLSLLVNKIILAKNGMTLWWAAKGDRTEATEDGFL